MMLDGHARAENAQKGFTLVEMLVALSLFAAIAAMGVSLLRSSIDTQDAVQERLKIMAGVNRLRAVMANDLAQAVQRATRDAEGASLPAFAGSPSGFSFVHTGASSRPGAPRPRLERVLYDFAGGEWRRASQPMLDGAAPGEGDRLARDVEAAAVRYRDAAGVWSENWTSEPGDRLPRAIELRLTRTGRETLILLFLVASTHVLPPADGSEP